MNRWSSFPHLHIDERIAMRMGRNDGPHNPLRSLHAYILIWKYLVHHVQRPYYMPYLPHMKKQPKILEP